MGITRPEKGTLTVNIMRKAFDFLSRCGDGCSWDCCCCGGVFVEMVNLNVSVVTVFVEVSDFFVTSLISDTNIMLVVKDGTLWTVQTNSVSMTTLYENVCKFIA